MENLIKQLAEFAWFKSVDRLEAEKLLLSSAVPNSTCIVRPTQTRKQLCLSYKSLRGDVVHSKIVTANGEWSVENTSKTFPTVSKLVQSLKLTPLTKLLEQQKNENAAVNSQQQTTTNSTATASTNDKKHDEDPTTTTVWVLVEPLGRDEAFTAVANMTAGEFLRQISSKLQLQNVALYKRLGSSNDLAPMLNSDSFLDVDLTKVRFVVKSASFAGGSSIATNNSGGALTKTPSTNSSSTKSNTKHYDTLPVLREAADKELQTSSSSSSSSSADSAVLSTSPPKSTTPTTNASSTTKPTTTTTTTTTTTAKVKPTLPSKSMEQTTTATTTTTTTITAAKVKQPTPNASATDASTAFFDDLLSDLDDVEKTLAGIADAKSTDAKTTMPTTPPSTSASNRETDNSNQNDDMFGELDINEKLIAKKKLQTMFDLIDGENEIGDEE